MAFREAKIRSFQSISILRDIYRVLKTGEAYVDQGAEAIYQRNSKAREQSMIRSLEKSGYSINQGCCLA
jgi:hypothetical protein